MKIIYYSPHPYQILKSPSGYGTHMREVIKAFKDLDHEVFPLIMGGTEYTSGEGGKPNSFKGQIKRIIPSIIWESLKDWQLLMFDRYARTKLEEAVKNIKPDLIYERANYMHISGGVVAKKYNVKNILEINSPFTEERTKYQGATIFEGLSERNDKLRVAAADKIIVVSSPLKKYLVTKHAVDSSKIVIIPNAIDPDKIKVDSQKSKELTEFLSLQNKFVIGFVGSIAKWHGVDILIQSFKKAVEKIPDARLLIVGGGETIDELKRMIEDLEIVSSVIFTGNVAHEDVFRYISIMDITVLPRTNWYMSPIKIFEYGAMGKCIIAPDNDPVKDVMKNEIDGLLIGPEKDDLTKAIERLYFDKELREKMALHFKKKVLANYTWQRSAEKILSLSPVL